MAVLLKSLESMKKLASTLDPTGEKVKGYACDVASDKSVNTAFENIKNNLGPVSTMICNVASFKFQPIDYWTAQEITSMTNINAAGVF